MPPRTSHRSPSSVAALEKKSTAASESAAMCCRPTVTIIWVVCFFMFLALWLVIFCYMVRLERVERSMMGMQEYVQVLEERAIEAEQSAANTSALQDMAVGVVNLTTSTPDTATSPSGLLHRGSWNSDMTRYAGYDETTKGKIGIGVEIPSTDQVKHIVIFSVFSESTGQGLPEESSMSVRWKDDRTIEYDVLVKKGGAWVKETQAVQIYF